ncbi:MAG: type II toxin-antitoxin system prevent-host-death family antitoxin [Nitrococcus sp.]|nr:type II toxin-antitoxin system prevent-host-death family antitoxin [Nitrococcus sp.]
MNKVSVVQAKAHFSEILAKVELGHDVVITRRGIPVARLSGLEHAKKTMQLDAIDAFRASLVPTAERSADLIRRMRDESY